MTTQPSVGPTRGQNVLHLFCHVAGDVEVDTLRAAIDEAKAKGLQVVCLAVLGAKADVGFMVLGADLWAIRSFQTRVQGSGLLISESYVSLTEVSEYAAGMPEKMIQDRLYPTLPPAGMHAYCFYPMSKRRGEQYNWYALDYDERERLMRQHGALGRTYKGRVLQVISGSTGLDDWEWGVTLFGVNVNDLKECVYEMRFDEASSRYASFGPFFTGLVGSLDEVLATTLP